MTFTVLLYDNSNVCLKVKQNRKYYKGVLRRLRDKIRQKENRVVTKLMVYLSWLSVFNRQTLYQKSEDYIPLTSQRPRPGFLWFILLPKIKSMLQGRRLTQLVTGTKTNSSKALRDILREALQDNFVKWGKCVNRGGSIMNNMWTG